MIRDKSPQSKGPASRRPFFVWYMPARPADVG
jgi:hypothetical protein